VDEQRAKLRSLQAETHATSPIRSPMRSPIPSPSPALAHRAQDAMRRDSRTVSTPTTGDSPPMSPRHFPRSISTDFAQQMVAAERMQGVLQRLDAMRVTAGFYRWVHSRLSLHSTGPPTPAPEDRTPPRTAMRPGGTAPSPGGPKPVRAIPEPFVKQMIATQRLVDTCRREAKVRMAFGFCRWCDSADKLRAMQPRMFKRWRHVSRIAKKIEEKSLMLSCFEVVAVHQYMQFWRDETATHSKGRLQTGAAVLARFRSDLGRFWHQWRLHGEETWGQQIRTRRALVRMMLQSLAQAWQAWKEIATQKTGASRKAHGMLKRLANQGLFVAWHSWLAAVEEGQTYSTRQRTGLLGFLKRAMREALMKWSSLTSQRRQRKHDGYGRQTKAIVVSHGEVQSDLSPLSRLEDEPLSEAGRRQALQLAHTWHTDFDGVDTCYVSPLSRCIETALIIFGTPSPVKLIIEPDLRDFVFKQHEGGQIEARCQGKCFAALKKLFPQRHIVWPEKSDEVLWWAPHGNFSNMSSPGTQPSVCERLSRFKESLITAHVGNVAVITHPHVALCLAGVWAFPACRPCELLIGYAGYAEMATQQPVVMATPVELVQAAAQARRAIVAVCLGASAAVLQARIHSALQLMQLQRIPLIIMVNETQVSSIRAAMQAFPWPLSPLERRLVMLDTHLQNLEDLLEFLPAALASIHLGSWECCVVTSDYALPRSLLALCEVPAWCRVTGHAVPTVADFLSEMSDAELKEGALLAQWAAEAPDEWLELLPRCKRELYIVRRNIRYWSLERMNGALQAKPGTPFSKHETTKRKELHESVLEWCSKQVEHEKLIDQRVLLATKLGEFYDNNVAIVHQSLESSGTIMHLLAEAFATDLLEDVINFWGGDLSTTNGDLCPAIDLINEQEPRGASLKRMLRSMASGDYYNNE